MFVLFLHLPLNWTNNHPPLYELGIQTKNGNVNGNNDVFSEESLKLMEWSR